MYLNSVLGLLLDILTFCLAAFSSSCIKAGEDWAGHTFLGPQAAGKMQGENCFCKAELDIEKHEDFHSKESTSFIIIPQNLSMLASVCLLVLLSSVLDVLAY